jgi:hypothetical protein
MVSDLLSRANLTDYKLVDTPTELNGRLNLQDGEPLRDPTLYRHLVGSLVYLTVTRPNISYAVHQVSQFMATPRSTHFSAVLRILRYLKETLFHKLHFSSQSPLDLHAYTDADWAGDPTDRRSTTGYCFLLGTSLISWRSKKQSVVARSSTEAEYRALANTTSEFLWLRWLLQDMGVSFSSATPVYCDNRSAIQIAHNDFFMNGPNILRLIVILFVISFFRVLYNFILSRLMINSQTSSPSLILQGGSAILYPTSR